EVLLLERSARIGGQAALAAAAPARAELADTLTRNYERLLAAGGVELRAGVETRPEEVSELSPDAVVVATGARPFRPHDLELEGVEELQAWDVLAGARPRGRRVVVVDWGGDPAGLDAAELLARTGNDVTLAVAAVAVGEALHQYARALYLQRLYRADVRVAHHLELVGAERGAVLFRNPFAPEVETELAADVVVLALGRVPVDGLAPELRARGLRVEEAGDCLTPRSLEEAILEGTLAARRIQATAVGFPSG
ncbi:MAG: FAD-dependent oxidoreductase, partial [Actinomycetota bacterium]|nr:FAD-dependent oxidoreductase [Actinomycetota bacterium]